MFETVKDGAKDAAKELAKKKIKAWIIGIIVTNLPIIISLFIVIIVVLIVLDIVQVDVGGNVASGGKTCGFTISSTSLSKSEYKQKIEEFSVNNPNFDIFAQNANEIYELAVSKQVNPELVVIRAYVEGSGKTTGSYNYWGLGCTNESEGAGCYSWDTFEEGYTYFIDVVSKYDSLTSMMGKYAYIGQYWYTLDTNNPSGDGGCYYAEYIYSDGNMPDRVKNACSATAPSCVINGDTTNCTATTDEDQEAYATWQIEKNMGAARKTIFGLEFSDGPCVGTSSGSLTALSNYNLHHEGLTKLNKSFSSDEVNEMNNFINSKVDEAGYGTGAGVAAAGQTLVSVLEQKGYYLGYYWGGDRSSLGIGTSWGVNRGIAITRGGNATGPEFGMDCSGFVSWSIRMGCNSNYGSKTASGYKELNTKSLSSLNEAKPGDILVSSGHVILIIKNNGDGTVIAAEESYSSMGLIFNKYTNLGNYSLRDRSSWYSTNCNSSR